MQDLFQSFRTLRNEASHGWGILHRDLEHHSSWIGRAEGMFTRKKLEIGDAEGEDVAQCIRVRSTELFRRHVQNGADKIALLCQPLCFLVPVDTRDTEVHDLDSAVRQEPYISRLH